MTFRSPHPATALAPVARGATDGAGKREKGARRRKAKQQQQEEEEEKAIEFELLQDLEALRHRKGDTGAFLAVGSAMALSLGLTSAFEQARYYGASRKPLLIPPLSPTFGPPLPTLTPSLPTTRSRLRRTDSTSPSISCDISPSPHPYHHQHFYHLSSCLLSSRRIRAPPNCRLPQWRHDSR